MTGPVRRSSDSSQTPGSKRPGSPIDRTAEKVQIVAEGVIGLSVSDASKTISTSRTSVKARIKFWEDWPKQATQAIDVLKDALKGGPKIKEVKFTDDQRKLLLETYKKKPFDNPVDVAKYNKLFTKGQMTTEEVQYLLKHLKAKVSEVHTTQSKANATASQSIAGNVQKPTKGTLVTPLPAKPPQSEKEKEEEIFYDVPELKEGSESEKSISEESIVLDEPPPNLGESPKATQESSAVHAVDGAPPAEPLVIRIVDSHGRKWKITIPANKARLMDPNLDLADALKHCYANALKTVPKGTILDVHLGEKHTDEVLCITASGEEQRFDPRQGTKPTDLENVHHFIKNLPPSKDYTPGTFKVVLKEDPNQPQSEAKSSVHAKLREDGSTASSSKVPPGVHAKLKSDSTASGSTGAGSKPSGSSTGSFPISSPSSGAFTAGGPASGSSDASFKPKSAVTGSFAANVPVSGAFTAGGGGPTKMPSTPSTPEKTSAAGASAKAASPLDSSPPKTSASTTSASSNPTASTPSNPAIPNAPAVPKAPPGGLKPVASAKTPAKPAFKPVGSLSAKPGPQAAVTIADIAQAKTQLKKPADPRSTSAASSKSEGNSPEVPPATAGSKPVASSSSGSTANPTTAIPSKPVVLAAPKVPPQVGSKPAAGIDPEEIKTAKYALKPVDTSQAKPAPQVAATSAAISRGTSALRKTGGPTTPPAASAKSEKTSDASPPERTRQLEAREVVSNLIFPNWQTEKFAKFNENKEPINSALNKMEEILNETDLYFIQGEGPKPTRNSFIAESKFSKDEPMRHEDMRPAHVLSERKGRSRSLTEEQLQEQIKKYHKLQERHRKLIEELKQKYP